MTRMAFVYTTSNTSTLFEFITEPDPIISDELMSWLEGVMKSIIFPLAILGTVTNAINIRVFIKQGVTSDTNTICLFALAVSDILGCVFLIPTTICKLLQHVATPATFQTCYNFSVLVGNIPHVIMSRNNCWITVYIAVERCLCVLMPFKVKTILKSWVAITGMLTIYLINILSYIPVYLNFVLQWRFVLEYNTTVAMYNIRSEFGRLYAKYLSLVSNVFMSVLAALITAVAYGLMLYKLNKYKKWRQKTASTGDNKSAAKGDNSDYSRSDAGTGKRDVEILKTVAMVTGLFLVCLTMSLIPGIAAALVPGLYPDANNKNIDHLTFVYKYVFDVLNSSLNFFFYIRVSSRYKTAFNAVFGTKL